MIAASGVVVEVNTGGIARGKIPDLYPSGWILERCLALDIPITLNSDCHGSEHVAGLFPETAARLRAMGFDTLHVLREGIWSPVAFDEHGLRW